jgi:hypothetical protein
MTSLLTRQKNQRGNALFYVLIAVVLFGALSFTMSRQMDSGEAGTISKENAALYAGQILNYATQAKASIEQMTFSGSKLNDLVFTLPGAATFESGTPIHKVFHPGGGGLVPGTLSNEALQDGSMDVLPPNWYIGRFNNTEWTASTEDDVMLVAYKIKKAICEEINLRLTGSISIPEIVTPLALFEVFVDPAVHLSGTPSDFTNAQCGDCEGFSSLCVGYNGDYAFYSVVGAQ